MSIVRQPKNEIKPPLPEWLETAILSYARRLGLDTSDTRGILSRLGFPHVEKWEVATDPKSGIPMFVCLYVPTKAAPILRCIAITLNLDCAIIAPRGAALMPKGTWSWK